MSGEEFKANILCHYRLMMAQAMAILCDRDEALDCIQDTLEMLWKLRDTLSAKKDIKGYCVVAVRNNARVRVRRLNRVADESELENIEIRDEQETASTEERFGLLNEGLSRLPELNREMLLLSASGAPASEISELTGLSEDNIRQINFRSRKKLKEFFKLKR